jgi:hypothetical protein
MTTRPTVSPLVATDATLGTGPESALSPRLDPGAGVRARGLLANNRAPARWFNWMLGLVGDWASYLDQKHQHCHNVLNFPGADPTGATASTAAIQAAIDAADADGGWVLIPPGLWQSGGWVVPKGVSICGVPDATFVAWNHATANQLVCTGSELGGPRVIQDIRFIGHVVTTGKSIVNNSAARVQFVRCSWNGFDAGGGTTNLQGPILGMASNGTVDFIDCLIEPAGDVDAIESSNGILRLVGNRIKMPPTYTQALILHTGGRAFINDNRFDCLSHTGAGVCIHASSLGAPTLIGGNLFEGDGGAPVPYAMRWDSLASVIVRPNDIRGMFPFHTSNGSLANGSEVALLPYRQDDNGDAETIALRSGYRRYLVRSTTNTSLAITLPPGYYDGQELDLTYYKSAGSSIVPSFTGTPVTGTVVPTINPGNTLTGRFVWQKREAAGLADRWIQIGTWGVGTTLV